MELLWAGFLVAVCIMLALDLGVFHRSAHAVSVKEALGWSLVWITIGTSFTGLVWAIYEHGWFGAQVLDEEGTPLVMSEGAGAIAATRYLTAYLLEKSLSVDNLFVIALVFDQFKIDHSHRHRVLFWGVLGAIVMRGLMLLGGLWLLHRFTWLFYVFGAYLAYTGIKLFFPEGPEEVEESRFLKKLKQWLHVAPEGTPHEGSFFVRVDGKRMMTTLGLALLMIEWMDLVFALDSIPAVLAVAPEPFIVFTSNILAILGLRSLYFVLENAVKKFHHLRYALAVILVFIGAKMITHKWFHVPNWISLTLIVVSLTVAILVSWLKDRESHAAPETEAE